MEISARDERMQSGVVDHLQPTRSTALRRVHTEREGTRKRGTRNVRAHEKRAQGTQHRMRHRTRHSTCGLCAGCTLALWAYPHARNRLHNQLSVSKPLQRTRRAATYLYSCIPLQRTRRAATYLYSCIPLQRTRCAAFVHHPPRDSAYAKW